MNARIACALIMAANAQAASGTLEVQVSKPDGADCTADVEVRKAGGTTVVKKFVALTGGGVTQLEGGDYDVKAVCRVGGYVGSKRVTVKGGSVSHHVIAAKAASTPPPDLGSGKLHVVAGSSPKLATGHVRVLTAGKEIGRAKVASNKFAVYDLKPGDYTLQLFDAKGKKIVEKKVTVKPQAVTLSP
jgi:hypothetical protein